VDPVGIMPLVREVCSTARAAHSSISFSAGFVSLDKPPIAVWLLVVSWKLIGFSEIALLLPQVIEGPLAAFIVYLWAQSTFGVSSALLAIAPAWMAHGFGDRRKSHRTGPRRPD
jgi:4-amino-4-deoxy-L-arabinose transferase-like glycosyltransferase